MENIKYKFYDSTADELHDVTKMEWSGYSKIKGIFCDIEKKNEIVEEVFELEDGELIQSTGYLDRDKNDIFDGSMVKVHFITGDNVRFVFWENGWRTLGLTQHEFSDNLDLIEVIGHRLANTEAYKTYCNQYKVK